MTSTSNGPEIDPRLYRHYRLEITLPDPPFGFNLGEGRPATDKRWFKIPIQNVIDLDSDPVTLSSSLGCIYCGLPVYDPARDDPCHTEHIIPEGLGGTLKMARASCRDCEGRTCSYEQSILRSTLWAPRRHLGVRIKKRKRDAEEYPIYSINGERTAIRLALQDYPTWLLLPIFGYPSRFFLNDQGPSGTLGYYMGNLNDNAQRLREIGVKKFALPAIDTVKFCQMLAKIAHAYAAATIGLHRLEPLLVGFIRSRYEKAEPERDRYIYIGGEPKAEPATEALHELGCCAMKIKGAVYLLVKIRFFANLGGPSYYVIPAQFSDTRCLGPKIPHEAPS